MKSFLEPVHPEWRPLVESAMSQMDPNYLESLLKTPGWLPGVFMLFNAFSLPLHETRYILFGESPYPRAASANGFAFWDAAVKALWGDVGFSRAVNRATSLRNFFKMLLHAEGVLCDDFSKEAIRDLDKTPYYSTGEDFFRGMLKRGFLLLNATLVYEAGKVNAHAKMWRPFLGELLSQLQQENRSITLILFGKIAERIPQRDQFDCITAEHPYNLSFITHPVVIDFFKPLRLLHHL